MRLGRFSERAGHVNHMGLRGLPQNPVVNGPKHRFLQREMR